MPGPWAFLKSNATPRGLGVAAGAVMLLMLTVQFALIPPYEAITGYLPFDAQPRLSQFMVGVELGAFAKGTATMAYVMYAIGDALADMATAWLFVLFWHGLFEKIPTRLFAFLARGGILLVPLYVLAMDLAAKAGFFRLLNGVEGPSYAATADFSVTVHRLAMVLADLRNYLTAAFVVIAIVSLLLKRYGRRERKPRVLL
ncbi:MAG: hypothetical protein K2P94_05150 [Rhodospirillaceae bacterium]|nr:hypothetical protein [Rhodospirillaceae bacterium]